MYGVYCIRYAFVLSVGQVLVVDNNSASNVSSVQIAIRHVNDEPPSVVSDMSEVTYMEEGGPVAIVGGNGSIQDLDHIPEHQNVTAVCTQILNDYPEDELLMLSNSSYVSNENETELCLDLTNCSNQSCYAALLSSLYYNNTADEPVLAMRIIELMVSALHKIVKLVAFICQAYHAI